MTTKSLTEVRVISLPEASWTLPMVCALAASRGVDIIDDDQRVKQCRTWTNRIGPGKFRSIAVANWNPRTRTFSVIMGRDAASIEIKAAVLATCAMAQHGDPEDGVGAWYAKRRDGETVLRATLAYRVDEAGSGEEADVSLPEDLTVESFLVLTGAAS